MLNSRDSGVSMIRKPSQGAITFKKFLRKVQKSLACVSEEFLPETTFYIFRTDNNAVLAKGIEGYDNAKNRANELRKSHNLKWDQIKLKAERNTTSNFGVSRNGLQYTDSYGKNSRMDYSPNYNPSKGRRFRGRYDSDGNYHDVD
jgi:hypothetical protein